MASTRTGLPQNEAVPIPDAVTGCMRAIQVTLNASAGTVTRITIPDGTKFIELATAGVVLYAIDEDPQTLATSSAATVAVADLSRGHVVSAGSRRIFLEPIRKKNKELRLTGNAGSEVVTVEMM